MPRGASRALYTGNGQAVEFPFFFKVFEEDQLSVLLTSPEGVTSAATGWPAELDESGGTVRYLHNGAPLPEGWKLAIMRDMPFVQEVDLITGTRFDPEVIETALDVATAERQQLLERLARAVVVEPPDEAGPEALLADIRDARSTATAAATSAQANANAAADSARAAAGSCAIATEEREAACVCAGEAKDARDVAIAQAEAANTLMEAELAKVNAIVAANRTDQQAAVTAAREWAEKAPDTPVDYDADGTPLYSARHWAENAQKIAIEPPTAERRGAVRVGRGLRLTTGENGETDVLAVAEELGCHLQLNAEQLITQSGSWVAPLTGWFDITLIGGGEGGVVTWSAGGGRGCAPKRVFKYYARGQEVPVTIAAGGTGSTNNWNAAVSGGATAFDDVSVKFNEASAQLLPSDCADRSAQVYSSYGGGTGGGRSWEAEIDGGYYGAGGGAFYQVSTNVKLAGNGHQGCVIVRWHDPAKVHGTLPALFSARRMAVRTASGPVTVNLFDPETGQGSVWREEDAEARLAEGMITEEAWLEICNAEAAEAYAGWLASPETEAERFEMLRRARDAKLAATDYLVAPDYPLTDAERAAVTAYRQALRDLPAQEGAPWDGGGPATPWPEAPVVSKVQDGE